MSGAALFIPASRDAGAARVFSGPWATGVGGMRLIPGTSPRSAVSLRLSTGGLKILLKPSVALDTEPSDPGCCAESLTLYRVQQTTQVQLKHIRRFPGIRDGVSEEAAVRIAFTCVDHFSFHEMFLF